MWIHWLKLVSVSNWQYLMLSFFNGISCSLSSVALRGLWWRSTRSREIKSSTCTWCYISYLYVSSKIIIRHITKQSKWASDHFAKPFNLNFNNIGHNEDPSDCRTMLWYGCIFCLNLQERLCHSTHSVWTGQFRIFRSSFGTHWTAHNVQMLHTWYES